MIIELGLFLIKYVSIPIVATFLLYKVLMYNRGGR